MKEHIIEEIEGLKQAVKLMRITNDITPSGLNALNAGLDVLIGVVKNVSSNSCVVKSVCGTHLELSVLPLNEKYKYCSKCGYYSPQTAL